MRETKGPTKIQAEFISTLIETVKERLLSKDYPKDWDGVEMRWMIKERFERVVWGDMTDKRSNRYKKFKDYCVANLLEG